MTVHYRDDRVTLHHGDCLDVLRSMPDASVDSIVTDPPYGLGFMGKAWDDLPPGREWAEECLRVLKPGGHLLAFGGTRTWHRLACAVEDAGFEVRDSIAWLYATGFPKSLSVSKALGDRRCRCDEVELGHGNDDLRGVRQGVSDVAAHPSAGEVADLLASVQRQGEGSGLGDVRAPRTDSEGHPSSDHVRRGQPSMEGWRDLLPAERQLRGGAVRPLPTGVPGDGAEGRVYRGAPSSDGSQAGPTPDPLRSGEPHQPRPAGQPAGELGAVPVERGSQEGRGWPLCGRCGKPSVPDGLGTALKPAFEPVVVARKPLVGTVAANVTTHGTGALNIDGCRIEHASEADRAESVNKNRHAEFGSAPGAKNTYGTFTEANVRDYDGSKGRWPANVVLDEDMAGVLDEQSGTSTSKAGGRSTRGESSSWDRQDGGMFDHGRDLPRTGHDDRGGASRFFLNVPADEPGHVYYCICGQEADDACPEHGGPRFMYAAKAPKKERPVVDGVAHPTVKPLALMRWLVRLVTPPGGTVLEPFAGSGTTVEACIVEGFHCIAIERGGEYLPLIVERIQRQDRARIEAEVTRAPDPARAIAEQVAGQLDIFGEATA